MNESMWFRAYVEQLLREQWGLDQVVSDTDGDYPYRYGTAACWVRVEHGSPLALRVMAHAAHSVKRTAKLLAELNEISSRTRFGSVTWVNGVVSCQYAVPASAVDAEVLGEVCRLVGSQADQLGELLATVFGGITPFDPEPVAEEAS